MERDEIARRVFGVVTDHFPETDGEITEETDLRVDLDIESIDIVEVIFDLEDEFGIRIEDDEINTVSTVADIIDLVKGKLSS